jgi:2-amino-4,5-dihydroxy-6-oxo-7-(phosphonooxy)heptanoate synthase
MTITYSGQVRLARLLGDPGRRLFVVPLDHPVADGPVLPKAGGLDRLVGQLAANGVDAVVLHKGGVRRVDPIRFAHMSLIVHLSASTMHAADPDAKYLVTTVEEAVRLGADAVSVHVNLGSRREATQIHDLGTVADACVRWGMPLLAMIYPRGPQISNPKDPGLVAHAATLAAELGVDIVKTPYVGEPAAMAEIVEACPIPIVVAGGPRQRDQASLMSYVDSVMGSGVAGLAMGRNIFQATEPGRAAAGVAAAVHRTTNRRLRTDPLAIAAG